MDIWYHRYSADNAKELHRLIVNQGGGSCARLNELPRENPEKVIYSVYHKTSHSHNASVQVLLLNSHNQTVTALRYMVDVLGFHDKMFIFGTSESRTKYTKQFQEALKLETTNNIQIFTLNELVNTGLGDLNDRLANFWRDGDQILDDLYRSAQEDHWRCSWTTAENETSCNVSDWLTSYVAGRNRPNQKILLSDWLITSHVIKITSSDWLFTKSGRFLVQGYQRVRIRRHSHPTTRC